ncbi:MAG: hypothetical protein GAK29_00269 [Acinetobacter bereziniae]|uniref:Uncharacterized protein n=1 Tax=Acinetobacter bereziniae TaxID=106648 RepID=A0A833PIG7_ACIBZ|nr:MAG: hypothetical protein GAK29_00269 [Acinetobacter bereziniae]
MKNSSQIILVFTAITALVISSILFVMMTLYIQPSFYMLGLNMAIIAISFLYIAHFIYKSLGETVSDKNSTPYAVYCIMTVLAGFLVFSALFFGDLYNLRDQKKFEASNFNELQSKELNTIKELGKENNVYVRYGNKNTSWANTRLIIPNSSGASLYIMNGYCALNYTDDSIKDMKSKLVKNIPKADLMAQQIDIAKITIQAHELAHCLDIKRDFATFNLDKIKDPKSPIIGNQAIAPKLRKNITDMEAYLDASATSESTLWKETFADLYAIGYLYIHHPLIADQVTHNLDIYRDKQEEDPEHASSCWLKLAQQSKKPTNNEQLIEWADNIRASKGCQNNFYS